ncbi:hypothetical protein DLAC_05816 [Tieghemostelium lacteum]|uniref:Uncharacterized protein n=1 Tax=Tieghemostelium lacteum TaxID=361077 RepID=A0A151ZH29_TIELA|nr:hypothetical protein DLAC_05816 [Tieghemostelium lacteum]|eukprot:KYQ93180.1 hypothetical protein DLAC_05816 [Tieghemostelium lacteum]
MSNDVKAKITILGTDTNIELTSDPKSISDEYLKKEYQEDTTGPYQDLIKSILSIKQQSNKALTVYVNTEKNELKQQQDKENENKNNSKVTKKTSKKKPAANKKDNNNNKNQKRTSDEPIENLDNRDEKYSKVE